MATSRQSQHAPTNKPRTYITTNLSQPPLARQPVPTPYPTPNPDAPINRNLDANGRPAWWSRMKFDSPRDRVQPKLTVGAPNDQYEQEADRVADQVMSMPDAATHAPVQREGMPEEELQTKPLAAAITPLVQREAMPEEEEAVQAKPSGNADIQREAMPEEEEVQTKPLASGTLQREEMAPEEEELQTKSLGTADLQREALPEEEDSLQTKPSPTPDSPLPTPHSLESQLSNTQGSGSPLPHDVRSFMEPRFGDDFSQVRVHTGSDAVQMNRDLNAQAFTHKQDVYFGAGKAPAKDTLTAHELTHVVQQTSQISTSTLTDTSYHSQQSQIMCEKNDAQAQDFDSINPVVSLAVDQEADGVGHAWIIIQMPDGSEDSYGFWPTDPNVLKMLLTKKSKGIVEHPDKAHKPNAIYPVETTMQSLQKGINYANSKKGSYYNLLTFNCSTFARKMFDLATGQEAPLGGILIDSPNDLANAIRERKGERWGNNNFGNK